MGRGQGHSPLPEYDNIFWKGLAIVGQFCVQWDDTGSTQLQWTIRPYVYKRMNVLTLNHKLNHGAAPYAIHIQIRLLNMLTDRNI